MDDDTRAEIAYGAPDAWGQIYLTCLFRGVPGEQARAVADECVKEHGAARMSSEDIDLSITMALDGAEIES